MTRINIGTAGWTVPREVADRFPCEGSALERYAARFPVVEINSSFHRPHRLSTWQRWRDSVPAAFRFAVKIPKLVTHQRKLVDCAEPLGQFLGEVSGLDDKLAVLLIQLPPKLGFDPAIAAPFLADLKSRTSASLACEPRHLSWFGEEADALLDRLGIARVAADPALCDAAARPGGWRGLSYWRLHGSPAIYRSSYADRIESYAALLLAETRAGRETWCLFDNTASAAAASDALQLADAIGTRSERD